VDLLKMPGVVYCEFEKGDCIIRQGELVETIYYLQSGSCYRCTITDKGEEIIYGIKESNDFVKSLLGVLIIFTDGYSNNNFIAQSKCVCYKIPKKVFMEYVSDKPDILKKLLYMAMEEYRELNSSFQSRQEGKVANRLCNLLLKNAKIKDGRLLVNKTYSNYGEISKFLGIHKVTVARIMKSLKEKGLIKIDKDGIIILDQEFRILPHSKIKKMNPGFSQGNSSL
jgi:CRP-like cAMP-binding protein